MVVSCQHLKISRFHREILISVFVIVATLNGPLEASKVVTSVGTQMQEFIIILE